MNTSQGTVPGLIEADALYTLPEIQARLRMGAWAWRTFRRRLNGRLPLIAHGNRKYARGSAVIEALESLNQEPVTV